MSFNLYSTRLVSEVLKWGGGYRDIKDLFYFSLVAFLPIMVINMRLKPGTSTPRLDLSLMTLRRCELLIEKSYTISWSI